MGRSQTTFSKREKEKKRKKKKEEKEKKKAERKANSTSNSLDDMIAYVDDKGNIVDTPPEEQKKEEVNAEDIVVGVPKKEKEEEPEFREGRVAFFNDSKGYGFINEKDTGEKYFVHINSCVDDIEENDNVRFDLEKGPRGLNAVNVVRT